MPLPLRVNVDGSYLEPESGARAYDFEVRTGDSIRVFAEVTMPENGQDAPVALNDTLIFALVGKDAKDKVQFADIENLQGETLYDYELEIAHETTDADTLKREELTNANQEFLTAEDQQKIYLDGENWFIRRVTMKESTAAHAMTGSGYAAYDAAIEMDRRDRRLAEAVRNTEGDNGLWVRLSHGRSGIDGQYRWDRSGVHIGFDREIVSGQYARRLVQLHEGRGGSPRHQRPR